MALLVLLVSVPSSGRTATDSSAQVWQVDSRGWTVEAEARYARWVEENITEDFFLRYKIPTDCADVPYAARWIYARIAHLPAAATTVDGRLIGHWTTDWRSLPTGTEWHRDPRFRAALRYMLARTSTRTLPLDTYPVRIDPGSITPGTVFFVSESHAGLVGHVYLDGSQAHPVQTWESTLPVKIRKLRLRDFYSPPPAPASHSGLVKFRWVIIEKGRWRYLPAERHPFFSDEQYAPSFSGDYGDYVEAVARRIDAKSYDPWVKVAKETETATRLLRERVPIVLAGYQRCRRGGCPEGSAVWESLSTPYRDERIVALMSHIAQLVDANQLDQTRVRALMESVAIEFSKDHSVTLYHAYRNCLWLSSDPGDPVEMRWGLRKCDMILARSRAIEKSIAFIERTYRQKDPRYADLETNRQRETLRTLESEWSASQCRK